MSPRRARDERPYAIYARLSRRKPNRPGQRRVRREDESVQRQERESLAYADERGLLVSKAHVYVDPHVSAWKDKGGRRDAWDKMMIAAASGELRGILVWKLDRFTRSPRQMEDLIDLADKHGVVIDGPKSGFIDLTTAAGRQQARGAAMQAAGESDNTSERVRAVIAEARRNGELIGGPRVFGFEYAGDHVHRPDEVALIREAATRMLAGEKLACIAADFTTRGVVTTTGKPFRASNLGRMLSRARYGGYVEHHGEIVGRVSGEPILDTDTYEAVRATLTSRRRGRRPTSRYELTGLARCGKPGCGHTMSGAVATKSRAKGTTNRLYRCPRHSDGCGLAINADVLEARVRARALELLTDPDTRIAIGKRDAALSEARSIANARLADIEAQLVDLETKKAIGDVIQAAYDAAKPILDRRREKALADLASVGAPSSGTLPEFDQDDWDDAEPGERRQIIRDLGMIITVLPLLPDAARNKVDVRRIIIEP